MPVMTTVTPSGVEHRKRFNRTIYDAEVMTTVTPSGVEHMSPPTARPAPMAVMTTVTPSGVEHKSRDQSARFAPIGCFNSATALRPWKPLALEHVRPQRISASSASGSALQDKKTGELQTMRS